LVSSKQAELDAAYFEESSELQAKDATIAELQSQLTAATEAKESQQKRHYNHRRPHSALGYRPPAPVVIKPKFAATS
jgi:hypothetical protein